MSRIKQVVSSTNTIVKKIVVGTPIKRVAGSASGISNIVTDNAVSRQVLLYDSDLGKFVPTTLEVGIDSAAITQLINSDYINNLVDPNLFPEIATDSAAIKSVVDSDYINARVTAVAAVGIDSGAVTALIDSDYINARVASVVATGTDSAAVQSMIDSDLNPVILNVADLDSDVRDLRSRAKVFDAAFDKRDLRIDSNSNSIVTLSNRIDSNYASIVTLSNRIDSNSTSIVTLSNRVDSLVVEAIDSNLVAKVIDSAYISNKFNVLNNINYERLYDSALDLIGSVSLTINRDILPAGGTSPSLGSVTHPFKDIYLSGQSIFMGNTKISEDPNTGTVTFEKVDATGSVVDGAKTTFSFLDSDVQAIQNFIYEQDSNKFTLSIANKPDIVINIDRMAELELLGDLKGPASFNIAPFPHTSATGGQVNIIGRLNVEGDLFRTAANTIDFTNAKLLELGTSFQNPADANGGGFIIGGANAYLRYNFNTDRFISNKGIVATDLTGKYRGFDSDLINTNTDGLPEGSRNLYYTNTRVDTRVQQVVDETYIQSRQLITQIDSNDISTIVARYVDSDYTSTVANLLDQLNSSTTIIQGVVDSDYITSKFQAVNGKVTSVTVEPSQTEYVYQPLSSDITFVQDSDVSGKQLRFDPDNVSVYLNGARLVTPYDFTTDSHGRRVTFAENIGPGNTIVITSARNDKINFSNALVDSAQDIATDSAGRFDVFAKNSFRYAKYLITANVIVNSVAKYQASEVLVIHNDIEASYSEYGVVQTQDSSLGDVIAEIEGANVKVSFDPAYANTTVKFSRLTL